uniref:Uncharacterized protein n=1 Tax=Meloidogyne enterolobii TaxID=390850 RepID=A0A6V7VSP5_MELEN|nr:unnamed protein product [Meloidogyne enterolobii]
MFKEFGLTEDAVLKHYQAAEETSTPLVMANDTERQLYDLEKINELNQLETNSVKALRKPIPIELIFDLFKTTITTIPFNFLCENRMLRSNEDITIVKIQQQKWLNNFIKNILTSSFVVYTLVWEAFSKRKLMLSQPALIPHILEINGEIYFPSHAFWDLTNAVNEAIHQNLVNQEGNLLNTMKNVVFTSLMEEINPNTNLPIFTVVDNQSKIVDKNYNFDSLFIEISDPHRFPGMSSISPSITTCELIYLQMYRIYLNEALKILQ